MVLPKHLLALAVLMTAFPAAAEEGEIVLRVGGTAGTPFTADCELKRDGGMHGFSVEDVVPFEATYTGTGLGCRVTASGTVDVSVSKGGSSSRSRISGGTARVNVGS